MQTIQKIVAVLALAAIALPAVSVTLVPVKEISPFAGVSADPDILSPKSALFHPTLPKLYINSLEAGKTPVYATSDWHKIGVIDHRFGSHNDLAPSQSSGYFYGKPVEGWFSHGGKYLWVTYYRWSDDSNAMKTSGFALIDTEKDELVKAFPTGNIPKFITADETSKKLVVSLWGENKLEIYDIQDVARVRKVKDIALGPAVIAKPGSNRDASCGMCIRGTVFIPGTQWVVVANMSGNAGMTVVDTVTGEALARWHHFPATPRHLQVYAGWLYFTSNASGTVGRFSIEELKNAVRDKRDPAYAAHKIGGGARTLKVTQKGVFVALNNTKKVASLPLDLSSVRLTDAPAFPVGLDVKDGLLAVTAQGHAGVGGHRVRIYKIID